MDKQKTRSVVLLVVITALILIGAKYFLQKSPKIAEDLPISSQAVLPDQVLETATSVNEERRQEIERR